MTLFPYTTLFRSKVRHREFDAGWKKVLENHFWDFLDFYFPEMSIKIDKSRGYAFLDQELAKIMRKSDSKKRRVDKLAKVYLQDQREIWILVHLEVQTYRDDEFAFRMYTYSYRIFDKYQKPVASLAILADPSPEFFPKSFEMEALGKVFVRFEFAAVKLLDWQGREEELKKHPNIFAIVTLASLKAYEKNFATRYDWKLLLTKFLYEKGHTQATIMALYEFLDAIMVLPEDLEIRYNDEITQYEEARKMKYITTAERIGIRKGRKEAVKENICRILEKRLGKIPEDFQKRLEKIEELKKLQEILDQSLEVKRIEDIGIE